MINIRDEGKSFSLRICSYEYPFCSASDDANWLSVNIEVDNGDGLCWCAQGPYLRTIEFIELLEWFRSLLAERNGKRISFTEGELGFVCGADGMLYVSLDFCFHPKGSRYKYGVDSEFLISFFLDDENCLRIVKDIEGAVAKFPVR